MFSRSAIRPGPIGCHPSLLREFAGAGEIPGSKGGKPAEMGWVKRAIKSVDIRREIDASDLLQALIGVSYVPAGPDWKQSARRLVDILIRGSRPHK